MTKILLTSTSTSLNNGRMAMRKPIIATLVGGVPEAIENGKTGILVEPDADKIAEKIEYLMCNKDFAKNLGKNMHKSF